VLTPVGQVIFRYHSSILVIIFFVGGAFADRSQLSLILFSKQAPIYTDKSLMIDQCL
jgi:hypothetical protein